MHSNRDILRAIKPAFTFTNCFSLSIFSLKDGKVIISVSKLFSSIFNFLLCIFLKCLRIFWYDYPGYEIYIINLTTYMFLGFCSLSFLNYLVCGRSIARCWNVILPLAGFIKDDAFYRKIFRVVCSQMIAFNSAYITFIIFYYYFFSIGVSDFTFYLGAYADYCIFMHFCTMGTFFTGGLYIGTKLIYTANEELAKLKQLEKYKISEELSFVKIEKIKDLGSQLKMIKDEDLSPLVDIYEKLCECFENLNDCFGTSVTACSMKNLMEMTLSCYFMVKHGGFATRLFFFWLMYCITAEWSLIHACEKFVKETQKSRRLIDLVVTESSSQVLKDTVQRFSRHLHHRQIKFTACKLFDLDYKLLYSVMTNLITYLVIVLQFDYSKKDTSNVSK